MSALYKYGSIASVAFALIIGAFFYGQHVANTANSLAQAKAVAKAQAQADKLSADNTALTARISKAEAAASVAVAAAANQPPEVRYVYVRPKPIPQSPTMAPVAITGPVYVSIGAVGLYDYSLGIPGLYGPGEPLDTASAVPSAVTISDYQLTAVSNNAACSVYTARLTGLQAKVKDWITAGAIKVVP